MTGEDKAAGALAEGEELFPAGRGHIATRAAEPEVLDTIFSEGFIGTEVQVNALKFALRIRLLERRNPLPRASQKFRVTPLRESLLNSSTFIRVILGHALVVPQDASSF